MTVKAKWQLAYNNQTIEGGQVFEIEAHEYEKYKNDVTPITKEVKETNFKKKMQTK